MSVSSEVARFAPGGSVRLKASGRRGLVHRVTAVGDTFHYEVLLFGDTETTVYAQEYLAADVDDESVEGRLKTWTFLDADTFRQALTVLKLRRPLQQNLYSYLASRTDLQPYQFKPVLKLLQSPYGRMLIADEVGLGKTIEAGIIMLELAARIPSMRRVLICCPPALRPKWRAEMLERFDQEFEIFTGEKAREEFAAPERVATPLKAIGSLHMLRSEPILEALAAGDIRFDLVIVDESHHMQNPETVSHLLGEQLSAAADHMLMLSATPLSLSTDNLFHQLSILVPEEFFDVHEFNATIEPNQHLNQAIRALRQRPPSPADALEELEEVLELRRGPRFRENPEFVELCEMLASLDGDVGPERSLELQARINELNTIGHVFTRTRKREVQEHFPQRRAHVIRVDLTDEEFEFYEAVTAFVRSRAGTEFSSFATIMPQRQVASSIPAAREYLRERWGREVAVDEDAAVETEFADEEGTLLPQLAVDDRLQRAWSAVEGYDTKYERFAEALVQMITGGTAADGKVLVFSFFRKTIEHLAARLREVEIEGRKLRASILYGPTPEKDRHEIVRAFREEPGPHVVLSSEVAAEGLDFEFANAMVNYDLPWNPMRVEQRIGRLDRYGQSAKVIHIFNFSVTNTIEERVLERLYERIGIFENAIGDLESILGDEIQWLTRELLQPDLTPKEEAEVLSQAADNILRRQADLERFERESQNLLGQDDVFTEQLNRLEREQRFVGPDEIRNFVAIGLRQHNAGLRLKDADDGTSVIRIPSSNDGVRELMANYLRGRDDKNHRAWRSVGRANAGSDWLVTFEPEAAKRNRELDFITLQHPLVGALLEQEPEQIRPTVALRVVDGERSGRFAFFLYLLRIHSFKPGLEFLPVAVELGGTVDDALSSRLMSVLTTAQSWEGQSYASDQELDVAVDCATTWVSERIEERRTELERTSDQVLDRRVESLSESHLRWLDHRRRLLADALLKGQQSIARLHQGYMRRREGEVEAKIAELESHKGVEIGYELVAGGLLEVGGS